MTPRLDMSTASVVVVGTFEPQVFHPSWFASHELFGDDTLAAASEGLQLVHRDYAAFTAGWLNIKVEPHRFEFLTTETVYDADLRDLVVNTFTLLSTSSVRAVGLNHEAHYLMDDLDALNELGYRLAPREPWEGILNGQGLQALVVAEPGDDPPGYLRVQVGPSGRITPGVAISLNDHFQLADSDETKLAEASDVLSLLADRWEEAKARGRSIPEKLVGLT